MHKKILSFLLIICTLILPLPVSAEDEYPALIGGYKWNCQTAGINNIQSVSGDGEFVYVLTKDEYLKEYNLLKLNDKLEIIKTTPLITKNERDYYSNVYVSPEGKIYLALFSPTDDESDYYGDFITYRLDGNKLTELTSVPDVHTPYTYWAWDEMKFWVFEDTGKSILYQRNWSGALGKPANGLIISDFKNANNESFSTEFDFYLDSNGDLYFSSYKKPLEMKKYYLDRQIYEPKDSDPVYSDLYKNSYGTVANPDLILSDDNGNLTAYSFGEKKSMVLNAETSEFSFTDRDDWFSPANGIVIVCDNGVIYRFQKTDEKYPDIKAVTVGYDKLAKEAAVRYVSAFNKEKSDYAAVLSSSPIDCDIFVSAVTSNFESLDIYELMGKDFFNPDEILVHLLKSEETDGKLYSFAADWRFDVMVGNADIVPDGGFQSFSAMEKLEKAHAENSVKNEYGEVLQNRLFYSKTQYDIFNLLFPFTQDNLGNPETDEMTVDIDNLKALTEYAKNYPTVDEYRASEDYEKYYYASDLPYKDYGYSYDFEYPYNREPPYEIDQFDIAAMRNGRYAAAIFNGETLPPASVFTAGNFFDNFHTFAAILFDGNVSFPGFFGKGAVMATPINAARISVPKNAASKESSKAFITWIMKESESGLSVSALRAGAELAVNTPHTHERNGITVRDKIYFSDNDIITIPDVSKELMDRLLDKVINDSFAAPNSYQTVENYLKKDEWRLSNEMDKVDINLYYKGKMTFDELAAEIETAAKNVMEHIKEEKFFFTELIY
jgi:hypothetical protein